MGFDQVARQDAKTDEEHPADRRFAVSAVAAVPFLALQAAFMAVDSSFQIFGIAILEFGIIPVAIPVFFAWCVYLGIEYWWRLKSREKKVLAFGWTGGLFLLGFLLPAAAVRPLLEQIPRLCRATQAIAWTTSLPDPRWNGNHRFVLVLIGTGTRENHRFTSAYLDWSGEANAEFTSIRLEPLSFQYDNYQRHHVLSAQALRERLSESGLPTAELDAISHDLMQVLENAARDKPIVAQLAKVRQVESSLEDDPDLVLGGVIWMVALFAVFQYVGYLTVGRPREERDGQPK